MPGTAPCTAPTSPKLHAVSAGVFGAWNGSLILLSGSCGERERERER